jgi:hypothetical protein
MSLPVLLTSDEVCDYLRISRRSLSRMQFEGWVQPVRIGKANRYKASDVALIVKYYGADPIAMNCECAGGCYCEEPMKSWPEARRYDSAADHGAFPDDPDEPTTD